MARWWHSFKGGVSRPSAVNRNRFRPRLEGCEERWVPDGNPTAAASTVSTPDPAAVAAAPRAMITFGNGFNIYSLTITITTADGVSHTVGPINLNTPAGTGNEARDFVLGILRDSGWNVAASGNLGIVINGVGDQNISTINNPYVTNLTPVPNNLAPTISTFGGATIAPDVAPPPRPTGN